MKQLDVCWATGIEGSRGRRLIVILQHHDFASIDSLIVAPLFRPTELPHVDRIRPRVKFKRQDYVLALDRLAAVPKRLLAPAGGELRAAHYEVMSGIDLIFVGF